VAAFTNAIMQILHTVQSHVSAHKEIYIPGFISEDISGAISVAYQIESFFWDLYPKKGSFWIPDLIKPADILKNKI